MAVDLVFQAQQEHAYPLALVFGQDETQLQLVELTLAAQLPGLAGTLRMLPVAEISAAIQLPGLRADLQLRPVAKVEALLPLPGLAGALQAAYASNTARPMVGQAAHRMQGGRDAITGAQLRHQQARVMRDLAGASRWQPGQRTGAPLRVPLPDLFLPAPVERRAAFTRAIASRAERLAAHQDASQRQLDRRTGFAEAIAARVQLASRHQETLRRRTSSRSGYQVAEPLQARRLQDGRLQAARPLPLYRAAGYENAWPPCGGRYTPPPPPDTGPCYRPALPISFLVDEPFAPHPAELLFRCGSWTPYPPTTVVIAVRRAYIVLNNVSLRRIDGDIELKVYSGNMAVDFGSWTWSWDAVLRKDSLPHVQRAPGEPPVELEANINGVAYRLRVLSVARDTEFASTRIRVSGQGRAAMLTAPYAPQLSFGSAVERTAQQLANDVLTLNGASIGWTIDWGITDWIVPGGAWAFQGTYIEALGDIAASVGAYVQPHATDQVLRILPEYPVAPWGWADLVPQLLLPGAAVEVEGTDWIDGPGYNRVFVGGVSTGVFGPFTRAGTAGDVLAPQVSHPLITAAEAHRQRGMTELARGASRIERKLKLQALPETGILMPGTVLDYQASEAQRGIVRRTQVAWGSATLRQTIGVEFHA